MSSLSGLVFALWALLRLCASVNKQRASAHPSIRTVSQLPRILPQDHSTLRSAGYALSSLLRYVRSSLCEFCRPSGAAICEAYVSTACQPLVKPGSTCEYLYSASNTSPKHTCSALVLVKWSRRNASPCSSITGTTASCRCVPACRRCCISLPVQSICESAEIAWASARFPHSSAAISLTSAYVQGE